MIVDRVEEIDLSELWEMGHRFLLLDLDNTLLSWKAGKVSGPVVEWIGRARELGFSMCIVSNSLIKWRVLRLGKILGIPAINRAVKPRKSGLLRALRLLDAPRQSTVVVGDQVFTDVLGGNRLGLYTILVRPVDRREFCATLIQRILEKILLRRWKRQGILQEVAGNNGTKYIRAAEGNF